MPGAKQQVNVNVSTVAWKYQLLAPSGWNAVEFDDSDWPQAVDEGQMGVAPWTGGWVSAFPGSSPAHWLWYYSSNGASPGDTSTVYFRSPKFEAKAATGILYVAADNSYTVYLNGTQVGSGTGAGASTVLNFTAGTTYVLAVKAKNTGGPGSLAVQITYQSPSVCPAGGQESCNSSCGWDAPTCCGGAGQPCCPGAFCLNGACTQAGGAVSAGNPAMPFGLCP